MSEIIKKLLLAEDKLMPEMDFRQPGFTDSTCGPFTKNKDIIQKLKKQEVQNTFLKMDQITLVFNMMWLMDILNIYLEERP